MDSPLDQIRALAGVRPSASTQGASGRTVPRPATGPASARRDGGPGTRMRWFLSVTMILAAAVAAFHQVLAEVLARGNAQWRVALVVIDWPSPVVQRDLAAAGAAALLLLAVVTKGFSRIGRALAWPAALAAIAAVLGAGPVVLVCAVVAVVVVLAVAIGVLFVVALLAILASMA